jgi:hypothetical protein
VKLVAAVIVVFTIAGSALATPPLDVRKSVGDLRATKTGVDRDGNFWAWNAADAEILRLDAAGRRSTSGSVPDAVNVDVDPARGIVALTDGGQSVTVLTWDGRVRTQFRLRNIASTLCWLDGDEVAVAPRFAPHRVEVWNAASKSMVRTLVPSPEIVPPVRGAVLARAILLRYDARRSELITVDAVKGDVLVLSPRGEVLRKAQLPAPKGFEAWLQQLDADARAQGTSNTPIVWGYPSLTVTDDGTIWLTESYDDRGVRALKVLRTGKVEQLTVAESGCPSRRFEAWQRHFVFYHDPKSPRPPCVGVRRH